MDNKQAAAVLRTASDCIPKFKNIETPMTDVAWLFEEIDSYGRIRSWALYDEWDGSCDFLAYCEAKFEESRKHGL